MKRISVLLICLCLYCPAVLAQKKVPVQYKKQFEKAFAFWQSTFSHFSCDDFVSSGQLQPFPGKVLRDFKTRAAMDSFYQLYLPMLAFTRDSNRFIDAHSQELGLEREDGRIVAHADIDGYVLLCDRKQRNCTAVVFCGSSAWIDEAVWLDDTQFILAGVASSDTSDKRNPRLYIGNTKTGMLQLYVNTNPKCYQQMDHYAAHRYKDLHIEGL